MSAARSNHFGVTFVALALMLCLEMNESIPNRLIPNPNAGCACLSLIRTENGGSSCEACTDRGCHAAGGICHSKYVFKQSDPQSPPCPLNGAIFKQSLRPAS